MALPYFPFYPDRWLASGTIDCLSLEQEGAYLRLLCRAWGCPGCTLPNDDTILMRWSRLSDANALRTLLEMCFDVTPDGWRNPALYHEWLKAKDKHEKAVKSAKSRIYHKKEPMRTHSERSADAMLTRTRTRTTTEDTSGKFKEPTIEEVRDYCNKQGYTNVDPIKFVAFYGSKGWMVGKNKMKNWHQAVMGWNNRHSSDSPSAKKPKRDIPVITVPEDWRK